MLVRAYVRVLTSLALFATGLAVVLGSASPVAATTLDATGATFQFGVTGQTVINTADLNRTRPPGTTITYREVATISATVIDAAVTFVDGANLGWPSSDPNRLITDGYIGYIDNGRGSEMSSPYLVHYIRPQIVAGWARIKVDFFATGTSNPVTLSGLVANFYDIDNEQSVEVEGATTYSLSSNTHVAATTVSAGTLLFTSTERGTTTTSPTLSAYTVGRAKVAFAPTSSVTYRILGPRNEQHFFEVDFSTGWNWDDNTGNGLERVMPASTPSALSPASQTVTGIAGCPLSTSTLLPSNFGGTVTYSLSIGTLPTGLTLNPNTGEISGTPQAPRSEIVAIAASGSVSGSAATTISFSITNPSIGLTPGNQTVNGTVGTAIAATSALTATNACAVTYAVTSGSLPAGLTLDPNTGAITGTPTAGSTGSIIITATDPVGRTATTSATFDIANGASSPLPGGVTNLINQPVTTTPSTTVPSTTLPPTTPSTTTPTTTAPPAPVPAPGGDLPELGSAETLVTENGEPVDVELVVENDEALVLRNQDFELRLRGNCTTGCTITQDTTGRETIHLDRNGTARVSGFGFLPGSLVHVWIFSEPRYLGALLVAPDGTYDGSFPLNDIEVGGHTLQANGISFDNVPRSANLGIIVVDNNALPTPGPTTLPATGTSNTTPITWALTLLAAGLTLITGTRRRRTTN